MKRSFLLALAAVFALQPLQASSQVFNGTPYDVEYLRFIGGSGQGGGFGVQVGPYLGSFRDGTGTPSTSRIGETLPFSLYCVDFLHSASNSNGLVNVTSLGGNLANTRLQDFSRYRKSAYLSSLFDSWQDHQVGSMAGFSKSQIWGGLHAAIWNIATGPLDLGSGDTATARDYFLGLANGTPGTTYDTTGWYILSEADVSLSNSSSGQEFLMRVSVPEPTTVLLMLTGLVMLVGVNRKRLLGVVEQA
ncbi:MAG: PEP-CTERM sorting domain-containing protein [Gemmatimonadetes bacterium]|nr:PEP-CTERM sorting domain-containing protein [Gemmatimonadota bacterium]MDA1102364.1 PEP-CTERM sorting domain-containing protein [Gemmatimonadota bacterium]